MKVGIIALKYEKVGRFKISMPCCLLTVFKFSKNDFPFFKKIKRKNTYDNKKLFFIFKKLEYLKKRLLSSPIASTVACPFSSFPLDWLGKKADYVVYLLSKNI